MMKKSLATAISRALALAGTAALSSPTYAQQQEASALEEITVTARKVEENLQDTPIAITAHHRRRARRSPGLQHRHARPAGAEPAVRQQRAAGRQQLFFGGVHPRHRPDRSRRPRSIRASGLYIDDVYIGNAVGGTMELRDIANVQVLRGPQGTLFGRNTIGGAVLHVDHGSGRRVRRQGARRVRRRTI